MSYPDIRYRFGISLINVSPFLTLSSFNLRISMQKYANIC